MDMQGNPYCRVSLTKPNKFDRVPKDIPCNLHGFANPKDLADEAEKRHPLNISCRDELPGNVKET